MLASLLDGLLPSLCLGCSATLVPGDRPLRLCPRCRGRLRPIDPARACRVCLRDSSSPRPGRLGWTCESCRRSPGPVDRLVVPWRYAAPLDGVILALKLRRFDFLADCLMDEAVARGVAERIRPVDLVVAVPMPWPRRLLRGVDASAELAAAAARAFRLPLDAPLRRSPIAPRQTGTGRADRLRRVESTLRPRAGVASRLLGRRVLVVDDVVTTGSTLRAMARALRALGASRVVALAMAATPERPPPGNRGGGSRSTRRLNEGILPLAHPMHDIR